MEEKEKKNLTSSVTFLMTLLRPRSTHPMAIPSPTPIAADTYRVVLSTSILLASDFGSGLPISD